jgi:hypothetical protein
LAHPNHGDRREKAYPLAQHPVNRAAASREQIPWCGIQTPDDLVQFSERRCDYRRQHSRLTEVLWERPAM